ncbi:lanthionine synthetase C family protein [uncultured Aquimarina sp.]|uniref:lanthionine synthetase C family protein n=1 Tax=uncultured Aquimarina sp. TaxID=575652 RepID=UPI002609E346|nr:lanthionine synthetase C family protein [uncultured Aquimarina sp.]
MEKKALLFQKLEEINNILKNSFNKEDIGVLSGASGISLFHFYYAELLNDNKIADAGVDKISKVVEAINEGYSYPTFCSGIAGAGWVIEFLKNEDFIEIDTDVLLSELDTYLCNSMETDIKKGNYDFLHGALGYAVYFFKRYENTNSLELKLKYKEYLLMFISNLTKVAQRKETNMLWWESAKNEINISMSHGMSSIINFLSRLYKYEDFKTLVKPLIDGAVAYILSCKNNKYDTLSLFPNIIFKDEIIDRNSRLAWCYGDLGIGVTLWQVGKLLDNTAYRKEAIDIVKYTSTRKTYKQTFVKDAGICHGSIGVMNMYNYMYRETKKTLFKEALDFWMDKTIEMAFHDDGYAGYKQFVENMKEGKKGDWKNQTNLLEGIAGIGLSIISYVAPFDTKWDECLMIS